MNNTKLGLSENAEGALAYVFGFISGIIFLIIERKNQFIKFHSLQSIMFFICVLILNFLISAVFSFPLLGFVFFKFIVSGFVAFVSFIAYIILIVMAYCGKVVKIPYIGEWAWQMSIK